MSGDILLRPDLTFSDGREWLPMPDLWALAQEDMPTEEWYASRDAALEARL